jgi:hypothetical protein
MKKTFFIAFILLATPLSTFAQEPSPAEDFQFVRELRRQHYLDLAREYLKRLAENAPAELKKELPLEQALTEMEAANEEPDSNKRIALFAEARQQFLAFLQANPSHPRAAETKLDIARATTLQGKTQLSRALLENDPRVRTAEGAKARATLVEAYKQLEQLPKTPQSELALALNLLDQSETYLNTGSDAEAQESGRLIQQARTILDKLGQGESASKITWQARAWAGRCEEMLDDPSKAIKTLQAVTEATGPAARDGKRLARYFLLLARKKLKEAPDPRKSLNRYLIDQAMSWLRDYPRYTHTPEGYGVQYWLASFLLAEAANPKINKREQEQHAGQARKYLSSLEHTENEFTDRAKRLKIEAMAKQGTFKEDIAKLRGFEDCYVRAQYEQMQIAEAAKQFKDAKSRVEEERKKHIAKIIKALQLGLKKPDVENFPIEAKNARTLLTYYLLEDNKPGEAIEIGEKFAREDKTYSSQAASAAIYALVAYGQLLAERESKAGDLKALQQDSEYQREKESMLLLARDMERLWPKDRAGDFARHQIALHQLRDDKNTEAIKELAGITPEYPSYIRTQYLLARAELQQAAQEKDKGDPQGYYKLALSALTTLPEPAATADGDTNSDYLQAKLLLALELYKGKKLKEVDAILAALAPKISAWKLDADANKEKEKRQKFEEGRQQLALYSTTLQADGDFREAKYKEVTQRLDPLVDKFNADQLPQLKESGVGPGVVGLDLRANVQLNNLERARVAIKALQALQSDKEGEKTDNTSAILAQLVNLITQQVEELRKKGDQENLKKAQAGFAALLQEVAGSQKTLSPKLSYLLARCYAGMDEHQKAADLLLKALADPEAGGDPPMQHAIQLLLVQEYRQLKALDKARALLDEILKGKDGKPGWGARIIDAQKAHVLLLEAEQKYAAAATLCDKYVKQLVRRIDDNRAKDHYFEFYYHLVFCILKHGQGTDNTEKKTKAVHDAAQRIVALEKAQSGFGSEESKKRFDELLEKEPELREQYNSLKGGK